MGRVRDTGTRIASAMVWEERWHPLRREWVVISSHRDRRPWRGETVDDARRQPAAVRARLLPLSRQLARVAARAIPLRRRVRVRQRPPVRRAVGARARAAARTASIATGAPTGVARVVCYTPRHDLTLAELAAERDRRTARDAASEQYRELAARPEVRHVLMFENKGEVVGVSNPHPHCQIYATNFVFKTIEMEARGVRRALRGARDACCSRTSSRRRRQDGRRIIASQRHARRVRSVLRALSVRDVRRAARDAREPRRAVRRRARAISRRRSRRRSSACDNLWRMPFPYVMVLHQAPTDGEATPAFISTSSSIRRSESPDCSSISRVPRSAAATSSTTPRRKRRPRELRRACRSVALSAALIVMTLMHGRLLLGRFSRCTTASARPWSQAFAARRRDELAGVARDDEGDTIYAVDRVSEDDARRRTRRDRARRAARARGRGAARRMARCCRDGTRERDCRWRILVDPIDGTRGLMYQKRQRVDPHRRRAEPRRRDRAARHRARGADGDPAASSSTSCDQLWAVRGGGVDARADRPPHGRAIAADAASVAAPTHRARLRVGRAGSFPARATCSPPSTTRSSTEVLGPAVAGKARVLRGSVHLDRRAALRARWPATTASSPTFVRCSTPVLAQRGLPRRSAVIRTISARC